MASNPQSTPPGNPADPFERWAAQRQRAGFVLIGLGAALAAIPITNVVLYRWQSLAALVWGTALALLVLGAGLYYLNAEAQGASLHEQADQLRICVLVVLGGSGLLTAVLGIVLPFAQPPLAMTDYPKIFEGGLSSWRQPGNAWALTRMAAALIGGLVLMFLGLIQARAFERTRTGLRRLLYGYNAVLGSLLLVLIVVLLNLLPYTGVRPFSYANETIDWTRAGIHSLHPATKKLIGELKEPVKVYLLGPARDRATFEFASLLDNCRAVNPRFTWEELSRDRNPAEIIELMRKYNVPDSEGVLIVYGTDPKVATDFIKHSDLAETNPMDESGRRFVFKGENALLNSLTYLASGKTKATVYFTQGSGELAYNERSTQRLDVGLGALIDELDRVSYQTRELNVTPTMDKIPDDADIVVIARPMQPMPDSFVKALRQYLRNDRGKDKKKGKVVVLFDVVLEGGKDTMVRTGLEGLMSEYGVKVGDNQILSPLPELSRFRATPLDITGVADSHSSTAIARAFSNEAEGTVSAFHFYRARTVEAVKSPPGTPSSNAAENLIVTPRFPPLVLQTDLRADPIALVNELRRDQNKLQERISQQPLSVAVTVTEGKTPAPIPGHEFMAKEGQPRMVVFGDATWISNRGLMQGTPNNFNLFVSCLSWLVERPDLGERVPPSQHDLYRLKAPPGSGTRLLFLPGILLVVGVLALGLGVWVVRRR
jgi:hypothetical protein